MFITLASKEIVYFLYTLLLLCDRIVQFSRDISIFFLNINVSFSGPLRFIGYFVHDSESSLKPFKLELCTYVSDIKTFTKIVFRVVVVHWPT